MAVTPQSDPTESVHQPSDPLVLADRHQQSIHRPERIGPYRILDELDEGGMGTVYLAERDKPIHQRVALKVIKLGMDTKQVIARFETEREALALMNHPNVARVFDAGVTDDGRPYFAMEYVPGLRITKFCDTHRLTTNERLHLFANVCNAVQHAHQKGIIHRDIKPSNVLVAIQDDKPVVKVIDFGVAKATQQRLTELTLFTEQGQLVGTPGYMSPEQAEMTALGIDTRTDIYSLGVLLYELLVGARPFDDKVLRQAGQAEIQRIIREVDPPKPSTRISSLGVDSTVIAHKRHTEPRALARELRGDLDWIVMKCLEKDRTRRYDTANELALEIRRHLDHKPVLAGPPKASYRVSKFVRRNRAAVVVATVLLAAVAAAGYFYWTARKAEFAAAKAESAAAQAKLAAAQAEFAQAEAMLYAEQAKNLQLRKKYDEAWDACQRALALDPNNSLALRTYAFLLLHQRGDFQAALDAYDRGLRPLEDEHMLPEDFHNRARLRRIFGQYDLALRDHDRAIALRPDVGIVYQGRALTRRMAGDADGAIEDFARMAQLDPEWFLQAQQWIGEIRMLRDGPGDQESAAQALAAARDQATKPFEITMVGISLGEVPPDRALAEAKTERLRCVAHYYIGSRLLVDGFRDAAMIHFEQCLAGGAHDLPETDLARWHLLRRGAP